MSVHCMATGAIPRSGNRVSLIEQRAVEPVARDLRPRGSEV